MERGACGARASDFALPDRSQAGTDTMAGKAQLVQRSRFNFLQEAQIWYNHDFDQRPLSDEFENVIVLSDDFYREITSHPIPTDLEAVKVLSGAPAALDLFMWLSYPRLCRGRVEV